MKQENLYGWNAYVWESGDISVGIVPQLGGRIMSLKFRGKELFFVQEKHAGETFDLSQLAVNKKKFGFRLWGGDKTWVSPEKSWLDKIPPLDLDAGPYSYFFDEKDNIVTMTSPVCRETGLRITRDIKFDRGNGLFLTETILNESQKRFECGIWNVTQVLRPCEIKIPCDRSDVRLYEDEAFRQCKPQNYLEETIDGTMIMCRDSEHFKFGAKLREGKVVAQIQGLIFNKTFPINENALYAHGSHAEVYNSADYPYCEVEVHSPMLVLKPGQTISQSQEWRLSEMLL